MAEADLKSIYLEMMTIDPNINKENRYGRLDPLAGIPSYFKKKTVKDLQKYLDFLKVNPEYNKTVHFDQIFNQNNFRNNVIVNIIDHIFLKRQERVSLPTIYQEIEEEIEKYKKLGLISQQQVNTLEKYYQNIEGIVKKDYAGIVEIDEDEYCDVPPCYMRIYRNDITSTRKNNDEDDEEFMDRYRGGKKNKRQRKTKNRRKSCRKKIKHRRKSCRKKRTKGRRRK